VSHFDEIKAMWQTPRNLGKSINTPDDDMFPYIDENNILYYSTKGKIGLGGFDIFKTEDSANTYKEPINLKFPINSGGDDFGITFMPKNKQKPLQPIAFFTSNRQDGLGDDDLYSITIKPFVFYVKGKVLDAEGNQPIGKSLVSLTNNAGKLLFSVNTTENGEFNGEVPFNSIQTLLANKTGYFASTPIEINSQGLTNDSLLELTLRLTPIPAPEVDFTLQGILYDLDKFDLRAESKVVLDSLAIILKNNPNLSIEIGSHTDSRAPADYNVELSKKRAQSCLNYLISKGIKKERLVAVGYGESKLLNDCSDGIDCSEEEHQLNRRTTFRVLNTEFKR
jgi:outer membrane protein OmpA-like peptidoglycan-associated protein